MLSCTPNYGADMLKVIGFKVGHAWSGGTRMLVTPVLVIQRVRKHIIKPN